MKKYNKVELDTFEFFEFAKKYLGLLAIIVSIPILSQVFRVIPSPDGNETSVLSLLSSFICLIVFGSTFIIKGHIYKLQKSKQKWKQFIPFLLAIILVIIAILFTGSFFENINKNTKIFDKCMVVSYLSIYPLLVGALGIVLISAYNQESAYRIQNIISSELNIESDNIYKLLLNYSNFKTTSSSNELTAFRDIGEEILSAARQNLFNLGSGMIEVPGRLTPDVQRIMARNFTESFHAVSYRDIEFWENLKTNEVANSYIQLNIDSKNLGTKISRIFIFSKEDIIDDFNKIKDIIKHQQSLNFGYAIMMKEEVISPSGFLTNGDLDFALFDKTKAVSFFRSFRENKRQFQALFYTKENRGTIRKQEGIYKKILTKCWFMNEEFIRCNDDYYGQTYIEDESNIGTVRDVLNRANKNLIDSLKQYKNEDFNSPLHEIDTLSNIDKTRPILCVESIDDIDKKLTDLKVIIECINDWLSNEK